MKTVYQPGSVIEAHMLANLLRQDGFSPFIQGEHLMGGVGELPLSGMLRLEVPINEYAAARALIERWEADQPREPLQTAQAAASPARLSPWLSGATGLLLGVLLTAGLYGASAQRGSPAATPQNAPAFVLQTDANGDGAPEVRTHWVGGMLQRIEYLHPATGLALRVEHFQASRLLHADIDTTGNGRLDTRVTYSPAGQALESRPLPGP